jgi:hypothetical protein
VSSTVLPFPDAARRRPLDLRARAMREPEAADGRDPLENVVSLFGFKLRKGKVDFEPTPGGEAA